MCGRDRLLPIFECPLVAVGVKRPIEPIIASSVIGTSQCREFFRGEKSGKYSIEKELDLRYQTTYAFNKASEQDNGSNT
jgi:hypothetical protein